MKNRYFKFFGLVAVLFATSYVQAERIVRDSVKIAGQMHHFAMVLPEGLPDQAPLVFVCHGYGGPADVKNWMNGAAERHHFAVCAPEGLRDPKKRQSWNVGYPFQAGWKEDEVSVLCQMAKIVQKKYHLSANNTFLTGMSNGGELCYLMAYSKQTTFKAIGSLSGLTLQWMYEKLSIPRPIPFFEIHGTKDHVSEWYGDLTNAGGWGAYMPVPVAVDALIAKNRCVKLTEDTIPSIAGKDKRYIVRHKYTQSLTGCDVWLYEVVNGSHSWFTDVIDTGEVMWEFFSQYLKK